ncbi:hypothetical protein FXO38_22582 [Capsicum annuum]|nr:hypothetical protein FXO38_22582 [Capsicum annuum]KAF3665517.1 hypothetical protein FXO37_10974 [Capsicum annuum]
MLETQIRGRDKQSNQKSVQGKTRRGKSEPPRTIYVPTGAIFGIDKPHPTANNNKAQRDSKTIVETEKESLNLSKDQGATQETKKVLAHEVLNRSNNNTKDSEEQVRINNDRVEKKGTQFKSMEKAKGKMIMINNPNKLTVDIFGGEWENVTTKDSKRKPDRKRGTKIQELMDKQTAAITQNSIDELMEETEIDQANSSKNEQTHRKATTNSDKEKGESGDKWADMTSSSSEEENTSDEEEEEEEKEKDEDEDEE